MRLIHCTRKLLKELAAQTVEPNEAPVMPDGLGNWYANLLRFERRKCILFTNEKTIYSFLVPAVLKKDLMNIKGLFLSHLSYNLQYEGFGTEVIEQIRQENQEIGFARTSSRRVLGFMIDFTFHYGFFIERAGGLQNMPLMKINAKINRTPISATKEGFYPIEMMREMISKLL